MAGIEYLEEKPGSQAYLELFESSGWNAVYEVDKAELSRALEASWYVMSAYDGDKLVGVGRVVSDGVLYAMIYDMIVKPSYQSKGIGTAILEKLIARCRRDQIRDIQLFSAKGKVQFYRERGFVERPEDAPGMRLKR
jgi:GNAT superfamily N-acetyltransferase